MLFTVLNKLVEQIIEDLALSVKRKTCLMMQLKYILLNEIFNYSFLLFNYSHNKKHLVMQNFK